MYFEIENTPEHVKKARRTESVLKKSPKEECPRLILAPFSRPPQVVFDNVLIGSSCERNLEVFNPSKQVQQITLGRELPPGLVIHLPAEWLELEPETCYCLTMMWTPSQPTAIRETIRFTNENRGRYDVIVVLKSVMNIKGKVNQPKSFKISPGKIKKKVSKKSPVAIYKKKSEIIYNTNKIKNSTHDQSAHHKIYETSNKENISMRNDYSIDSCPNKCPFDSPTSIDFAFNTSEVFSNMRKPSILQQTYDKSYDISKNTLNVSQNILKPSNKLMCDTQNYSVLLDNLTFTPLKSLPTKSEKLEKGPQIILSMNSESDFDDSLDMKNSNKDIQTHSIISITSSQPPNKWLTVNHHAQLETQYMETPTVPNKKHPNTSSPKELNSPNFSINTDFSRISDLSFLPQRFSTERKGFPKFYNETHEIIDDINTKLSSDTFTKDSPNMPVEHHLYQMNMDTKPPHYFMREQYPKICRQALFKEYQQQREALDKNFLNTFEHNVWQNDLRTDIRSPPRSITPPLQSIPEESTQFSETQVLDKTDKQMSTFTINRTFDKCHERSSMSINSRQSWSKKAIRAEPDLWKIPVAHIKKSFKPKTSIKSKESLCGKISNATFEGNRTVTQNVSVNQVGNVYSQSFTVDPFLSTGYFYDEEAVEKFEREFKRWLNCILTPPADLDSNIEQKIDVGKAWIENRNKDVPAAPTKEHVSNVYHNNHRLESLRRSARTLLMSPEISQVFQKLNAQIEKKLITIRTDKNLHLDVGLQKIIMELLLSYNPLWLRIGLEAIYGLVLPLKSNSDIEGLTTFIIQRMFKNPYLKNKNSKSNVPNMLLPAYMEAIKKFTLKKFLMLILFLDQAKLRKLISHDPCLFCRNAICKESREIVIRFTRELIAGIGDITKHLRPLGYVVSHKQSYLDEYKYGVHNIARDIRDGVRLTKVMEIILMKNGLLTQLRTPAISRLQKIHNVQVALNALKDANFVIVGEITANDIADGHREKTLSLLWQLIHVFRAPLFEKAANVIQTWWRKKYEVIVEKKKEEEKIKQKQYNAACVIQCWWRRIQYNRLVEWKMQQITTATVIIQKYYRMWRCRTRLRKFKSSVLKIENWYRSVKIVQEAKGMLDKLRLEREELKRTSAIVIQSYIRRWLCMKRFNLEVKNIVRIQSMVRGVLIRKRYVQLKKSVTYIQQKYRSKLIMKREMHRLAAQKGSAIVIQSYYRMIKQQRYFLKLKKSVQIIEDRYISLRKMRNDREYYLKLRKNVIAMQALYRCKKCRTDYTKHRKLIIMSQRKIRANRIMKREKANYLKVKNAALVLQKYVKSYLVMKKVRQTYILQRESAILIQSYFRSYLIAKSQRQTYIQLRNASIVVQRAYKSLLLMRQDRSTFLELKNAALLIQRQYRAQIMMKECKESYTKLRVAVIVSQRRFRAQMEMKKARFNYLKLKESCNTIQNTYRAYAQGKKQRENFLKQKQAAIMIQNWYRNCRKGKELKEQYQLTKQACVTIQRFYKAYIIGKTQRQEYIRIKAATVSIQRYYRSYSEMKTVRQQFVRLKTTTVTIQRFYRSHLETKKQRDSYLRMKSAVCLIENYYRRYKLCKTIKNEYFRLKETVIYVQRRYRSICAMRFEREKFLKQKHSVATIQKRYRATVAMRKERQMYLKLRSVAITLQSRFRAQSLMKQERLKYVTILKTCISIQRFYRAYKTANKQRNDYLKLKQFTVILQRRYKAILAMRKHRASYLATRAATIIIQKRYRGRSLMLQDRYKYTKTLKACVTIQRAYRAYLAGKNQRMEYVKMKSAVILIQNRFRSIRQARRIRNQYQQLRRAVVSTQRHFRERRLARTTRRNVAASKIQTWYKSVQKRNKCRREFMELKERVTIIQSTIRMYIIRKKYLAIKNATLTIQRYYRSYRLCKIERQIYLKFRTNIIKLQTRVRRFIERKRYLRVRSAVMTIQAAYRFKRQIDIIKSQKEAAALCLQKYVRRYLVQKRYRQYRESVVLLQKIWRGKLLTRMMRCEFLQKRRLVIALQSIIRGYLVRKQVEYRRVHLLKIREEQRMNWAASKIQALFRGHKSRVNIAHDKRVAELRRRWRDGALKSTQESLKERNEEAMDVLRNMSDIETVIRAFRSLELLTEVFPMMYNDNAPSIVRRVYVYMSLTNRSISSIEVLKSAAAVLVNLTRYRITGPKIYARDLIPPILKYMWRFSNSESQLFCILSTYLWLLTKYDGVREDLTELLHVPENHKMLVTIKSNVDRMKRMASNAMKNKFNTPQPSKIISRTVNQSFNASVYSSNSNCSILLPSLEPDYGIIRVDKPRYFEDAKQAIDCLFRSFNL